MSLEPWSDRPKVDELSLTDILMRRVPSSATKNQETPFSDVLPFIYENIAALTDGTTTITSDAQVGFEQGGSAFRASFLVNPENVIAVENQAQLEAKLGTNLEIPDDEARTIIYLKSFTQTKPFLLGVNSSLQLVQATTNMTTTYTGTGAYIQMTTPGTSATRLFTRGLFTVVGDGTNSVIDAKFAGDVTMETTIAPNFQDFGTIDCPFINITSIILVGLTTGIVIKDCNVFEGRLINIIQTGAVGITGLTVIGTTPTVATIQQLNGTLFAGDALLFLDPNTTGRSVVTNCNLNLGDFYQQGTDIAINSVADNGSGDTEFTAAAAHGLIVGRPVVLSGFVTQTTYNQTAIVTAISGLTFDCAIAFVATDTGNLNAASLDSTSVIVSAENNQRSPDSMSHAEARTGATLTVDGSGGVDVPIEDLTPAPGDWIQDPNTEEFTVDLSTGLITYNGIEDRTYLITYQLTATPTSGPNQVLDFDVHVNGVVQPKATVTIDTASVTKATYVGGLFVLSSGDTVQLFKDNTTNTNNTDVSVATVLITTA